MSPVKDEAEHLPLTARALIEQSHLPVQWVIVDDGSTDATPAIAEALAAEHDWITVVRPGGSAERARGAPIVRAFDAGVATLRERPEVVVKLDGDLFLPAHYFAWVAETFARVPRAGVVGGVAMINDGTRWVRDAVAAHNVNGVAKAYRFACLDDIGGLQPSMGWDGIDEYAARARGWEVHVLSELPILHYRLRGARQAWPRARWEEGVAAHFMGYRPDFLLLRAAYRMAVERPPLLGGLVLAASFTWARLTGAPQVEDAAARGVLRAEQRARMRALFALRGAEAAPPEIPGGGPAQWAVQDSDQRAATAASTSRSSST